jgi:hypothetical protein
MLNVFSEAVGTIAIVRRNNFDGSRTAALRQRANVIVFASHNKGV